jgi:hypothetical protein
MARERATAGCADGAGAAAAARGGAGGAGGALGLASVGAVAGIGPASLFFAAVRSVVTLPRASRSWIASARLRMPLSMRCSAGRLPSKLRPRIDTCSRVCARIDASETKSSQ